MSGELYLTFDVDWAHDAVVADMLALLDELGVASATVFATHPSPTLAAMRERGLEVGVHPNLAALLEEGSPPDASARRVLEEARALVPDACSVRSHGLVRSPRLSRLFRDQGFSHEANLLVPRASGIALRPWEDPPGLLQVPHDFGDYHQAAAGTPFDAAAYLGEPGLHVMNFHPIHLFLNTDGLDTYERARPHLKDPEALAQLRNTQRPGSRDLLAGVVAEAHRRGQRLCAVRDARR